MEIKNIDLLKLSDVLNSFKEKQTPFSTTLIKNNTILSKELEEYDKKRIELVDEYVLKTETGGYLGKIIPNSDPEERYVNSNVLDELEIELRDELYAKLNNLDTTTINIELNKIDLKKKYFETKLNDVSTIEDYINTNVEISIINLMFIYELIEL